MTVVALIMAGALLQGGWTWTLYEGEGRLVLANEIPDTSQLKTTLECGAGAGVARIVLYGPPPGSGFATLTSGPAAATSEIASASGGQSVAIPTAHPVFGQFVASGTLDVAVAGRHQSVQVESAHLAKLRRFAELCSG